MWCPIGYERFRAETRPLVPHSAQCDGGVWSRTEYRSARQTEGCRPATANDDDTAHGAERAGQAYEGRQRGLTSQTYHSPEYSLALQSDAVS